MISKLIIDFLFWLGIGVMAFSGLVPIKLTGSGLIRVLSGVSLGSLLISSVFVISSGPKHLLFYCLASLFIVLYLSWEVLNQFEEKSKIHWIFHIFTLFLYAFMGIKFLHLDFINALYFILSSLFLGSMTYAMILGHWYLVTPKISEEPLLISIKFFWGFLILKILISCMAYFDGDGFLTSELWRKDYIFNWIMLSMRILWGYVALAVLSIFAWKLTKMRSIQSATGVLYVMVFFIFVGEVAAIFLYHKFGAFL